MDVEALKRKYGRIYEVSVEDGENTYKGVFRRPDMGTMSAFTKLSKTDEFKAMQVLITNCLIEGDTEIKEDALVLMQAAGQLTSLVTAQKATIKNL